MSNQRSTHSPSLQIPSHRIPLPGSERRPSANAQMLSAADAGETLKVTIALRRRTDGPPMPDFDSFAKTPPSQRQRLSQNEFAEKYGADPDEVARVVAFVQLNGLEVVETHLGRRSVVVSGTVAQMNQAFGVSLGRYQHTIAAAHGKEPKVETYRGRDGAIQVPSDLADIIVGVFGLDNRTITKRNGSPGDPTYTQPESIATITQLYNFPTNSAAGQTIAIFSVGGYLLSDLQTYFGTPTPPVASTAVDAPNGGYADGETTQDICIAATAASGAQIQVYFTTGDQTGWYDLLHRVVHPSPGDPTCSVLSSSFYICDGDDLGTLANEGVSVSFINAVHSAFEDAAVQGVTICIAAGDTGSNSKVGANPSAWGYGFAGDGKAHVQYPGSDPWVLSVGGTTIGGATALPPPFVEYVWNDPDPSDPSQWGTTGGGVSDYFDKPSYQQSANVPKSVNPRQTRVGRGVPDVAGDASNNSGYAGLVIGGATNQTGNGTSASAPMWAGLIAVLNAALGHNLGFVNPTLYSLGPSVFRDIAPPPGPTTNSNAGIRGYTSGPGWDACTGWGSPNGTALLAALQAGSQKDCYFILDWQTFVKQGLSEMLMQSNPAVFSPAFYVVVEGFTATDLGIGSATPVAPVLSYAPALPSGMTVTQTGEATPDPTNPLRFTFTYNVSFSDVSGFPTPMTEIEIVTLNATITGAITNDTASGYAPIDLTTQSAPFMVPGSTSWLSNDVRVFQVDSSNPPAWLNNLGITLGNTGNPTSDATTLIQQIIGAFNGLASSQLPPNHPFDGISLDETVSELDIDQLDPGSQPVYNFAVARVRYQDPTVDAENVRVFFRTFPALAVSTAYEPSTTYRRWSDGVEFGDTISLLGSQYDSSLGMQLETVPFFASPRVNATSVSMDTQTDEPNVQTLVHNSANAVVYSYYGCWLDINQPEQKLYPQAPTTDGPFTGPLVPVLNLLANQHQCITAEIAYDPVPIAVGATPGTTSLLGQRNLTLGTAANPGHEASRLVPNPFELRSTPLNLEKGAAPDELMIDWGDLPKGSLATLYLPQASAAAIIAEAKTLYGESTLTQVDAHTLGFPASGITYIPVPTNKGANLAALLSVELPVGIRKGQTFNAIVRQIASPEVSPVRGQATARSPLGWRRILGSFQLRIPVLKTSEMREPQARLLSLLRWMEERVGKESRWLPVFTRYVQQVAACVAALGVNTSLVLASPTGDWQGVGNGKLLPVGRMEEFTGKIAGIKYSRFGDFEGFVLETEQGHEKAFEGREPEVEHLVERAWNERILVTILADQVHPRTPASIIYRKI